MGTRADFYIGRGDKAEWLGSIAWDGYPNGLERQVLECRTEPSFRKEVATLHTREDWTQPEQGWPWPWENSAITDYTYAFDKGRVWASCFGGAWFRADKDEPEDKGKKKSAVFPDMTSRQKTTFGKRSGVIMISARGAEKDLP